MNKEIDVDYPSHPAVAAWAKLHPGQPMAGRIDTLQDDPVATVYRLDGLGPGASALIAKRCTRTIAELERVVYEEILERASMPALQYYGYVEESDGEFCWVFLEDAGDEEYSPLIEEHRALAARWLGSMHIAATSVAVKTYLPDRGPGYYLEHLREARETILRGLSNPSLRAEGAEVLKALVSHCDFLEHHWDGIDEFCTRIPQTLVHGDFVGKNVRVRLTRAGPALAPFDWEMSGCGAPGADLAGAANVPWKSTRWMPQPLLGGCADIRLYWSVVREAWPHLHLEDLQQLANYGGIFRLLAAISWDSWMLDREGEIAAYIRMGEVYESWLADSIRAMAWT